MSLAGSAAYVAARFRDNASAAAFAKIVASTAFIAIAMVNGAMESIYGRFIVIALVLSWIGDVLLLSLKSNLLIAGVASFFLAHIAFTMAFATRKMNATAGVVALVFVVILGIAVLRWLWNYLDGRYRIAVSLYFAAIGIMVVFAFAAGVGSSMLMVAVGAVAFAISDISVARERFVRRSILNKAWGLPLYYLGQVLLAASVSVPPV